MPFEYQKSSWDEAVLEHAEKLRNIVGFDGIYSLPTEQRVILTVQQLGALDMLKRVVQSLGLTPEQGKELYFSLLKVPHAESIKELDEFFHQLLGHHVAL